MEYRYENAKDLLDFHVDGLRYNIMHATRISDNQRVYVLSILDSDPYYHLTVQIDYNSLEKAVKRLNQFLNS